MRLSLSVMTLTTAVVLLAGCGASPSDGNAADPPEGFMSLSQTQDEYNQTVADFPYELPAGLTFPEQVQQPTESTVYQKGAGLVQAYQFWECGWMDQFLTDQGTDATAADHALELLQTGTSSVYRTQYVIDDDGNWSKTALGRAKLGDPSVLAAFYDSDCTWYRTETGK